MSSGEKPAVHSYQIVVDSEVIDRNGHVNNVSYVRWMQDAAVNHSRAVLPDGTYRGTNGTWVARSHHIEYLKPVFEKETIEVRTWLAKLRRVRCQRKYEFVRISDDALVARSETDWVFVDIENGRPKSIPQEILDAFEPVENDS